MLSGLATLVYFNVLLSLERICHMRTQKKSAPKDCQSSPSGCNGRKTQSWTEALGFPRTSRRGCFSLHWDIGWSSLIRSWVPKGMNESGDSLICV